MSITKNDNFLIAAPKPTRTIDIVGPDGVRPNGADYITLDDIPLGLQYAGLPVYDMNDKRLHILKTPGVKGAAVWEALKIDIADIADFPALGAANMVLAIDASGQKLEWVAPSGGSTTTFVGLTDTPNALGNPNQVLSIVAGVTGGKSIAWVDAPNTLSFEAPLNKDTAGKVKINKAEFALKGDQNTFTKKNTFVDIDARDIAAHSLAIKGATDLTTISAILSKGKNTVELGGASVSIMLTAAGTKNRIDSLSTGLEFIANDNKALSIDDNQMATFEKPVAGPDAAADNQFVTKKQLDAHTGGGSSLPAITVDDEVLTVVGGAAAWAKPADAGVKAFVNLTDTPNDMVGQAGSAVIVQNTASPTELEYYSGFADTAKENIFEELTTFKKNVDVDGIFIGKPVGIADVDRIGGRSKVLIVGQTNAGADQVNGFATISQVAPEGYTYGIGYGTAGINALEPLIRLSVDTRGGSGSYVRGAGVQLTIDEINAGDDKSFVTKEWIKTLERDYKESDPIWTAEEKNVPRLDRYNTFNNSQKINGDLAANRILTGNLSAPDAVFIFRYLGGSGSRFDVNKNRLILRHESFDIFEAGNKHIEFPKLTKAYIDAGKPTSAVTKEWVEDQVGNGGISEPVIDGSYVRQKNGPAFSWEPITSVAGPKGDQGDQGVQGPQGNDGNKGLDGTSLSLKGATTEANIRLKTGAVGELWIIADPGNANDGDGLVSDGAGNWTNVGPIKGPQGGRGIQGVAGDKGDKGDDGQTGTTGSRGPQGNPGTQGPQGPLGLTGADGLQGLQGVKGDDSTAVGPQGPKGDVGAAGSTGANGVPGLKGDPGVKGDKGSDGLIGANGAKGNDGVQGLKGDKGDKGDNGTAGSKGDTGDKGAQGDTGLKGDVGSVGPKGDSGKDGSGVTIKGSDTYDNITRLVGADAGDMWIASADDAVNTVTAGDGIVYDGTKWENVGPIRGPKGIDGTDGNHGTNGLKGDQGDQGVKGNAGADSKVPGPQGAKGAKGDQGDQGVKGVDGAKGVAGSDGSDGSNGAKGDKGDTGADGTDGTDGVKGDQGDIGTKGDQGDKGDVGAKGNVGLKGDQGVQGPQGPTGITGPEGPNGQDGAVGQRGETGPDGPIGHVGATGATGLTGGTGLTGAKGDQGDKGDVGTKGNDGATGPQGPAGADGVGSKGDKGDAGIQGPAGSQGTTGAKGNPGVKGDKGAAGKDGVKGDTGLTGARGAQGNDGSQGPKGDDGAKGATGADGPQGKTGNGVTIKGSATYAVIIAKTGAVGEMWIATDTAHSGDGIISDGKGSGASHWTNVGPIRGEKGDKGSTGAKGNIGANGVTGGQGIQGVKGDQGPIGPKGNTGAKGGTGAAGKDGAAGTVGPKGATGAQGATGGKGTKGDKGLQGDAGQRGPTGPKGTDGNDGGTGPKGSTGAAGPRGLKGDAGAPGPKGSQGPKGDAGPKGIQGVKGATGGKGATGPKGVQGVTGQTGPAGAANLDTSSQGAVLISKGGKAGRGYNNFKYSDSNAVLTLTGKYYADVRSKGSVSQAFASGANADISMPSAGSVFIHSRGWMETRNRPGITSTAASSIDMAFERRNAASGTNHKMLPYFGAAMDGVRSIYLVAGKADQGYASMLNSKLQVGMGIYVPDDTDPNYLTVGGSALLKGDGAIYRLSNKAGTKLADLRLDKNNGNLGLVATHGAVYVSSKGVNHLHIEGKNVLPAIDNQINLGNASNRWKEIRAVAGNFTGGVIAQSFKKVGGLATQYLMANGSVSTGPSGGGGGAYLPLSGGSGSGKSMTGTLYGKAANFTGTLTGKAATFSGIVTADNFVDKQSERKFKRDIAVVPYGLDTVNKLSPSEFVLKESGAKQFGFIVDEIEQVVPEAVVEVENTNDERGFNKTVDMVHMIPMLVKAIQDLSAEVEILKDKLNR